jgi:hypothetical protein
VKRLVAFLFIIQFNSLVFSQGDSLWQRKIIPSDLSNNDHFGHSVALYPDYFLVGAPGDSIYGDNSGSVYIIGYDDGNISLIKKLVPDFGQPNEQFGYSVLALNNYIFIGTPGNNEFGANSGVVYVFGYQDSNWIQLQKIYANNPSQGDAFGSSLSGNAAWGWLLVGAPNKTFNDTATGALFFYILNNNSWLYENQLFPAYGNMNQKFGWVHDQVSNIILIGSPGDNTYGTSSGAVYKYLYDETSHEWYYLSKNYAPQPQSGDEFGFSLDYDRKGCMIGSPGFGNVGKAYLYKVTNPGLTFDREYQPNDVNFGDKVGFSVSYYVYNMGRAIVGIPGGFANNQTGRASILYTTVFSLNQLFYTVPIFGSAGDKYGYSVDNNFDYYLVGSPYNDDGGLNAGAVYLNKWVHWEIPVELISFTASISLNKIQLDWVTASELNNNCFEIQRKFGSNDFVTIGSVKGHGTTTSPNQYRYIDKQVDPGKYFYRLKQIDYNGTFEYSPEVEVKWSPFTTYKLEQNYPNPFNPTTKISWQSPVSSWQTLRVYDILGNEVATLVNEYKPAGSYEVELDVSGLSSGVYFYQLRAAPETSSPKGQAGRSFVETKKMILAK